MPFGSKDRPRARAGRRLCAVSVDLDEIPCYAAIHGLALSLSGESAQAVYRRALPRLAALFDRLAIRATFFAVGRDLEQPHAAQALRELAAQGHEIANHSYEHRYDLTRLPAAAMREQVARGSDAITRAVGTPAVGFRAPGYTFTDALGLTLRELGIVYDSSVFPCPAYYAPKLAAISSYRALGRPTRSIIDHPRVLSAPAEPYRMSESYTRRARTPAHSSGRALLELPIGVTRDATGRLPFFGTSLILAGHAGAQLLCRLTEGRELVNLELHGIDAADADLDALTALRTVQWDLRKPAHVKLAILEASLRRLRAAGYSFVTLAQAADAFADA